MRLLRKKRLDMYSRELEDLGAGIRYDYPEAILY